MSGTFHSLDEAQAYIKTLSRERLADGFTIYEPRRERKLNVTGMKEFRPRLETSQQAKLVLVWNYLIERYGKTLGVDIAIQRLERPLPDEEPQEQDARA